MLDLTPQVIRFANGRAAPMLHVPQGTPPLAMMDALALARPRAMLIVNGGTGKIDADVTARLAELLQEGVARLVVDDHVTVMTGGTDAGIFALLGQGMAKRTPSAPCIGVAVYNLATWPGRDAGEAPLEPHHSHFILVEGQDWGDETTTMYALAEELARGRPSAALFANGGEITIHEMLANVRQARPMILLAGSGRTTDAVLAVRGGGPTDDPRLVEIARYDGILVFDIHQTPDALRALIRSVLVRP